MYSVHTTRPMAGLGQAVILICTGEQNRIRFAEYHIVFVHPGQGRISHRIRIEGPKEAVNDDLALGYELQLATDRVQVESDQAARNLFPWEAIPPAIVVFRGNDRDI
jgi:hypothetical protein